MFVPDFLFNEANLFSAFCWIHSEKSILDLAIVVIGQEIEKLLHFYCNVLSFCCCICNGQMEWDKDIGHED